MHLLDHVEVVRVAADYLREREVVSVRDQHRQLLEPEVDGPESVLCVVRDLGDAALRERHALPHLLEFTRCRLYLAWYSTPRIDVRRRTPSAITQDGSGAADYL